MSDEFEKITKKIEEIEKVLSPVRYTN